MTGSKMTGSTWFGIQARLRRIMSKPIVQAITPAVAGSGIAVGWKLLSTTLLPE